MSERPVFDQVNIVSRDVAASVEFYRRLGLEIPDENPPWDRHHRSAKTGDGPDLDIDSEAFAHEWDAAWPDGSTRPVIGFKLPSRDAVDALYDELTGAGYTGHNAPWDTFWGARYAIVEDPDGNPVGLMSPVDPGRRSRPPDVAGL